MNTDNPHTLYIKQCEEFAKTTGKPVMIPRLVFPGMEAPYRLIPYVPPMPEILAEDPYSEALLPD